MTATKSGNSSGLLLAESHAGGRAEAVVAKLSV
jgi:hypothetical protein